MNKTNTHRDGDLDIPKQLWKPRVVDFELFKEVLMEIK